MILRLDKYLANQGIGTRSEVKKWIGTGKVCVNGEVVKKPEVKVNSEKDEIVVSGKILVYEEFEYYLLNKPAGVITAISDQRHKTVMDLLDVTRKGLVPVGRLDIDTEGLLLITNDGQLAHQLLSPAHHVEKVYFAHIKGKLPDNAKEQFLAGLDIGEKKKTLPAKLEVLGKKEEYTLVNVTLCEGKFHQVKRMFQALNCEVVYLKRVKMGGLSLSDDLAPGEYKKLSEEEINVIKCGSSTI